MKPLEVRNVIGRFIDYCMGESEADATGRTETLVRLLDELALAVSSVEAAADSEGEEPPESGSNLLRGVIGMRFPQLGYYNVAGDVIDRIAETDVLVGDAVDDLFDIVTELQRVLWRWVNNGLEDAIWYFRASYEWHWGAHLRSLQLYLHEVQTEERKAV